MVHALLRTILKITVASLLVGTVLSHFGITADRIMQEAGVSPQRLAELAERALTWALPNLSLGLLIILPMWFLAYLFRPRGARSD